MPSQLLKGSLREKTRGAPDSQQAADGTLTFDEVQPPGSVSQTHP